MYTHFSVLCAKSFIMNDLENCSSSDIKKFRSEPLSKDARPDIENIRQIADSLVRVVLNDDKPSDKQEMLSSSD